MTGDQRGGVALPLDAFEGQEEGFVVLVSAEAREEELDDRDILSAFQPTVVVEAGELEAGVGVEDLSLVDAAFPERTLVILG